jgi:hypothetical protein
VRRTLLALLVPAGVIAAACSNPATSAPELKGMTAASHDALFPIVGGTHDGVACDTCHEGAESFTHFSCVNCHAEHGQPRIDSTHLGVVAGYAWSPTSCYACHPRGTAAGIDHARFFPIGAGAVHAAVACSSCHPNPSDRKVFDCVGCHAEAQTASPASNITARHSGVAGYAWASASCYQCHPDSTVPAVDHAAFFPIAAGSKHAGIACSTCHTVPGDRKVFDCLGCHTEPSTTPNHAGVTAYAWASPQCYACHPTAEVPPFPHTAFPIGAGAKHAGISCVKCHPVPGDRKQIDCVSCHTAAATTPAHAGVTGYTWTSSACFTCHPDATVTSSINHALEFPIAAGERHAGISCATCHIDPAVRTTVSCVNGCHAQTPTATEHSPVGGYTYSSPRCLRCHADAQVDLVAQHLPFRIQSGFKHYRRACLTCHPAVRTDKPFGADFLRAKVACTGCHDPADKNHFNQAALTCLGSGCHPDGEKR